jgi:hypothetical protein
MHECMLISTLSFVYSRCNCASIILLQAHDSAAKQEEETAWEAERHESKYARTLEQLPATKKVCAPPAGRPG